MSLQTSSASDPIGALLAADEMGVLAVITGVEGPSYRPVGALMAIFSDGRRVGMLSSGCIEADLALHAATALRDNTPVSLRYGRGSPFRDIELPCGGGLDVLLIPAPDLSTLRRVFADRDAREPCAIEITPERGTLRHLAEGQTGWIEGRFIRHFAPELRFLVFGKGPESSTFAALVRSANFPALLLSPDAETLDAGRAARCETRAIVSPGWPADLAADPWTAVVLFFHDHEWEPPILLSALGGPAFYVGAQGSQRARNTREAALEAAGASAADLARLRGPIGLVASARDARTLAVSVLAEILGEAMAQKLS